MDIKYLHRSVARRHWGQMNPIKISVDPSGGTSDHVLAKVKCKINQKHDLRKLARFAPYLYHLVKNHGYVPVYAF